MVLSLVVTSAFGVLKLGRPAAAGYRTRRASLYPGLHPGLQVKRPFRPNALFESEFALSDSTVLITMRTLPACGAGGV